MIFQPTRPLRGATFEQGSISIPKIISTHAPLAGRDLAPLNHVPDDVEFQPTRPLRGATLGIRALTRSSCISTHAPLAGRDPVKPLDHAPLIISTHAPLAGRDSAVRQLAQSGLFQPTRPLRGATTGTVVYHSQVRISTHAPLAGRDRVAVGVLHDVLISTHAPLAGRDLILFAVLLVFGLFQPTRPLRGATLLYHRIFYSSIDFNPRAPCGARQQAHLQF